MRSPIIAFSIMAAATVSPSLVSAAPNTSGGNAITHPRVTEVETKGSSNPFQLRRQLPNELKGLSGGGDPLSALLHESPEADPGATSSQPTTNPLGDTPAQDLPAVAQPVDSTAGTVENTAGTADGAVQNAAPVEPVAPATPYQQGQVNTADTPMHDKSSRVPYGNTRGKYAHTGSKAEIVNEM